jgi:bacterial/archaeal transporter family protein
MEWIYFTLAAMLLWTVVNIFDKYIISHELRDPMMVTTVFGFVIYLVFIVTSFIFDGAQVLDTEVKFASIIAGILYSVALWFYYYVMKREEVSRFVPILASEPFIITIVAFFLFGERFKLLNYAGMALIVIGAIVISIKKHKKKIKHKHLLFFALFSVILFASRNILFKFATTNPSDFWAVMFWTGVGGIIFPILLFVFHHPHLRKQGWEGVYHLAFNALLSGMAVIFFTKAISTGTVSLASALLATKPMLVFLIATFLSFFHPKIMREKITRPVLIKKTIAIILIVAGGICVVL